MTITNIPVLETKRLVLKAPQPQDYPDFKATFASYRSRFMGGPLNAYETWMLYAAEIGHWEIRGYGMWMVHLRDTDETVGMAGGWCPAIPMAPASGMSPHPMRIFRSSKGRA